MPGVALVATQLTDRTSRGYVLTINGLDMNVTGQSSPSWSVDENSIVIEEEGPPGISGLSLTIWDPSRQVTLTQMAPVFFYDVTNDITLFRGFVDEWNASTEAIGRSLVVRCIGIEAVLDWMILPADVTIVTGTRIDAAIQSLYYMATGVGVPLKALANDNGLASNTGGSAALPIGTFHIGVGLGEGMDRDAVISAGDTLRIAIGKVIAATDPDTAGTRSGVVPGNAPIGFATVDFNTGLRVWPDYFSPFTTFTVDDSTGATHAAAVLDHNTDSGAIPRTVFVSDGANPANVTIVTDGTGLPGPTASLVDTTLTTAAARQAAGQTFLAQYFLATRGSLTRAPFSPALGSTHPGSLLSLTNTQLGLSSASYPITSIRKTFVAGKQEWQIAYGGRPPNPGGQIRRIASLRATVQR